MHARTLSVLALSALALAGCSTGNNSSEPSSSSEPESSASPTSTGTPAPSESDTAEDTPTADPSGDDMTTDESRELAEKNIAAAQGKKITVHAHADSNASLSWTNGHDDYGKELTGDWSKTDEPKEPGLWMVNVSADDDNAKVSCSVEVDGKVVDSDEGAGMVICLQQPETFVQDR